MLRDEGHEVTALFLNPNIHPVQEYLRRREAMQEVSRRLDLPVIWRDAEYDPAAWMRQMAWREQPGVRCRVCYATRLERTHAIAARGGYEAFTTSLLYSRRQRHDMIAEVGHGVAAASPDGSVPFRVAALGGSSDAVGTTYSVKAVDGVATVTVTDGVVRVSGQTAPGGVELLAEQQTSYVAGGFPVPVTSVDSDAVLAWHRGRIIFEGRPFASAVAELGRYVPERIVMGPGIDASVPVSAIFSADEALAAVQALAQTQGLRARRVPGVLIVIS